MERRRAQRPDPAGSKSAGLPVLVTRPEAAGRIATETLCAQGFDALWLPSFDLGPAPDPLAVEQALARLASFDLVVFVSPAAARRFAGYYLAAHAAARAWPAGTRIAAVGQASAAAARAVLPTAAPCIAPGTDAETDLRAGSEALWATLHEQGIRPRRVLVVRAQGGRDWLLERWRAAGAEVTVLAAYRRSLHEPTAAESTWLAAHAHVPALASVISSSEAPAALERQCAPWPDMPVALRAGPTLATHARVGERLRAAGYANVQLVGPQPEEWRARLRG